MSQHYSVSGGRENRLGPMTRALIFKGPIESGTCQVYETIVRGPPETNTHIDFGASTSIIKSMCAICYGAVI